MWVHHPFPRRDKRFLHDVASEDLGVEALAMLCVRCSEGQCSRGVGDTVLTPASITAWHQRGRKSIRYVRITAMKSIRYVG